MWLLKFYITKLSGKYEFLCWFGKFMNWNFINLKFNSEWFVGLLQILITKKEKSLGYGRKKWQSKLDLEAQKNEGINGIKLYLKNKQKPSKFIELSSLLWSSINTISHISAVCTLFRHKHIIYIFEISKVLKWKLVSYSIFI